MLLQSVATYLNKKNAVGLGCGPVTRTHHQGKLDLCHSGKTHFIRERLQEHKTATCTHDVMFSAEASFQDQDGDGPTIGGELMSNLSRLCRTDGGGCRHPPPSPIYYNVTAVDGRAAHPLQPSHYEESILRKR